MKNQQKDKNRLNIHSWEEFKEKQEARSLSHVIVLPFLDLPAEEYVECKIWKQLWKSTLEHSTLNRLT